jgi:hypothetical protein
MADLDIDLDELGSLRARLVAIQHTFERAEEIGAGVAGYTGHPALASVVEDFAGSWSIHRRELLAKLEFIQDAVQAIHDTMNEVDQKLAATLDVDVTRATR